MNEEMCGCYGRPLAPLTLPEPCKHKWYLIDTVEDDEERRWSLYYCEKCLLMEWHRQPPSPEKSVTPVARRTGFIADKVER